MNRDELYRIWKAEKNEKALQKIPPSFYDDVARLISDCESSAVAAGQDLTQKALFEKELKILRRLSAEIAETRMKKILDVALTRQQIPTEVLSKEEGEFAKQIALHVGGHTRFIDELAKGRGPATEMAATVKRAEARREVVRFLSDFPAIIGVDLKTYGPFKAEDIGTLPAENASALINQGVVKHIHFSEGIPAE
jgi:DNA replication factor GINS